MPQTVADFKPKQ
jgi:hypothetical protein